MAYNETLAQRIRNVVADRPNVTERKMFGGIAFMAGGNMFCGVVKDDLMARVGADQFDAALKRPHARPMDFTGRPMKGMIYVGPTGAKSDGDLQAWVAECLSFAESLPPK